MSFERSFIVKFKILKEEDFICIASSREHLQT
jgi:hypothetical protein